MVSELGPVVVRNEGAEVLFTSVSGRWFHGFEFRGERRLELLGNDGSLPYLEPLQQLREGQGEDRGSPDLLGVLEKGRPVSGEGANPGIEVARCFYWGNEGGDSVEVDMCCFKKQSLHVFEVTKDGSGRNPCAKGDLLGRRTQGAVANTIDHCSGDGRVRPLRPLLTSILRLFGNYCHLS